jgi:hypothetical protein
MRFAYRGSDTIMRTIEEDLALVIANVHHFTSVAFRGRGQYDRIESPTLEAAREAARQLYTNRPVMIYVVALNLDGATARERHVENFGP